MNRPRPWQMFDFVRWPYRVCQWDRLSPHPGPGSHLFRRCYRSRLAGKCTNTYMYSFSNPNDLERPNLVRKCHAIYVSAGFYCVQKSSQKKKWQFSKTTQYFAYLILTDCFLKNISYFDRFCNQTCCPNWNFSTTNSGNFDWYRFGQKPHEFSPIQLRVVDRLRKNV